MGREEVMASTGFVPAHICWCVYAASAATVALVFAAPVSDDPWRNGLAAISLATVTIYAFSFAYSNTSCYDPAWCLLPIFTALGWMATADAAPSARGWCGLGLLLLWFSRYALWWPWPGWTRGVDTEDWRYPELAAKVGGANAVYWVLSLLSLHLTPTWLVFFAVGPMQRVWTEGSAGPPPGPADAAGVLVALLSIAANGLADSQLSRFKQRAAGRRPKETEHCSSCCREGLWAYSRHPNYLSEASFWLGIALLAFAGDQARAVPWNWAFGGSVTMYAFFRVSGSLMDARSLKHRKGYRLVMREVPSVMPLPMAVDSALDRVLIPAELMANSP